MFAPWWTERAATRGHRAANRHPIGIPPRRTDVYESIDERRLVAPARVAVGLAASATIITASTVTGSMFGIAGVGLLLGVVVIALIVLAALMI